MAKISVTREQQATHGRYVARIEGFPGEAELTYTRPNPSVVSADHTGTPVALRGQGIATALVEQLVADARRESFKIRPVCPFLTKVNVPFRITASASPETSPPPIGSSRCCRAWRSRGLR